VSRERLDAWRDRRLHPLGFILDGVEYEIPEHPARVWVLALLSDEPADLLLDLLPDDVAEELWEDAIDLDVDLTQELLVSIGRAMLAKAAARPWWQAQMLLATLADDWDLFIGFARDRALGDPLTWPVDELCAWIYHRLVVNASKEDRERLDAELRTPPIAALEEDADDWADDEAAGWNALAAQYGSAGQPGA
jgi:hypothetical protein